MSQKILIITHSSSANPGRVGRYLKQRGYLLEICYPIGGEALPDRLSDYAGTVIFGGPMSVNDTEEFPALLAEIKLIQRAIEEDHRLLGICLGAQLIARSQGEAVAPHPSGRVEIGYFPITAIAGADPLFDTTQYFYQWHQEGFCLPQHAVRLAQGSSYFPNQAFRLKNNIYGVQFHPEVTTDIMELWMERAAHKLVFPGAQQPEKQRTENEKHRQDVETWLNQFFDLWL